MKRNSIFLGLFIASISIVSCGTPEKTNTDTPPPAASAEATDYAIDLTSSTVFWKGEMLGMYSHEGTMKFNKGDFTVVDGALQSGSFVVDMKSINPTDDGYDPENGKGPEVLVGHLSSDDFFNVESYPTASLVIKEGDAFLTVRDKTNAVELKDVEITESNGTVLAKASLTFNRKDFGVAFDHPAQEMVLNNDIVLTVEVNGK